MTPALKQWTLPLNSDPSLKQWTLPLNSEPCPWTATLKQRTVSLNSEPCPWTATLKLNSDLKQWTLSLNSGPCPWTVTPALRRRPAELTLRNTVSEDHQVRKHHCESDTGTVSRATLGKLGEMGQSAYGLFPVYKYHLELNGTERASKTIIQHGTPNKSCSLWLTLLLLVASTYFPA